MTEALEIPAAAEGGAGELALNRRLRLSDGRALGYAEFGPACGRPILYFHGFPGSRLEARMAAGIAARLQLRLIAPDRPGVGLSDFQPRRILGDWPRDVLELADALGLRRFAVLGVSGGGPYAAVCAARIPFRLTRVGIVAGLAPPGEAEAGRVGDPWGRFAFFLARHFPWLGRPLYLGAARTLRRQSAALLGAAACPRAGAGPGSPRPARGAGSAARLGPRRRCRQRPRRRPGTAHLRPPLGVPAAGDPAGSASLARQLDATVPVAMGRYLARTIPKCRACFIPGEGHFSLPVNHLEEILAALAT